MNRGSVQRRRDARPFHGLKAFDNDPDFPALRAGCGFIPNPQDAPTTSQGRLRQATHAHRAGGGEITV
jgi:hypothetical protein